MGMILYKQLCIQKYIYIQINEYNLINNINKYKQAPAQTPTLPPYPQIINKQQPRYTQINIRITTTMLQVHSPQFSNSNKLNLASLISPSRNKRIASVQNCCSSLHTHRNNNANSNSNFNGYPNNSNKKLQSPRAADFCLNSSSNNNNNSNLNNNVKMRKKSQSNQIKGKPKQIIAEMNTLREQYINMKIAYKQLAMKHSQKQTMLEEQNIRLRSQNEKISRDRENLKGKVDFLESEVDRIKRQSMKLIEIWQFRTSRIQQNLKQKQNIIGDLKQHLKIHGIDEPRSSTKKTVLDMYEYEQKYNNQAHQLALLSQSVIMGKYHRENISRMSEYLSISLNQLKQQNVETDQPVARQLQVSADVAGSLGDITNRTKQEQNKKNLHNTKKFKKQMNKKIQVNIQDRNKQILSQLQPKTPLQRKTGKNNKSSKTKLKKQEQFFDKQIKSSKKKMSIKC